jgi:hypothetical protein
MPIYDLPQTDFFEKNFSVLPLLQNSSTGCGCGLFLFAARLNNPKPAQPV